MKYLLPFLLVFSAQAADYNYIELSQGVKINNMPWGDSTWKGNCPTSIAIGHHWDSEKWYYRAEGRHTSNICVGKPFEKSGRETTLDSLNITIGVKF